METTIDGPETDAPASAKPLHAGQDKAALLARLRRIEGQVRGVARMIEDDRYCLDILTQLQAITAATDKVAQQVLEGHIRGCVADAIRDDGVDGADGDAAIRELMTALGKAMSR